VLSAQWSVLSSCASICTPLKSLLITDP
jgi:hypothetical protein